jgi:hypothetical protein
MKCTLRPPGSDPCSRARNRPAVHGWDEGEQRSEWVRVLPEDGRPHVVPAWVLPSGTGERVKYRLWSLTAVVWVFLVALGGVICPGQLHDTSARLGLIPVALAVIQQLVLSRDPRLRVCPSGELGPPIELGGILSEAQPCYLSA